MGGRAIRVAARLAFVVPLAACLESPPGRGEPACGIDDGLAEIRLGRDHACARLQNGGVWCWGLNEQGQLGDGTAIDRSAPSQVAGMRDATRLAVGQDHSCALRTDQTLWCWGSGSNGQLGVGRVADAIDPVPVELAGVEDVALGDDFSCAVADGAVWCWGENAYGQAGPSGDDEVTLPAPVEVGGRAVAVVAGANHACVLLESGGVACWGSNEVGQLGDGTLADRPTGAAIDGLSGISGLAAGSGHTCAVDREGEVRCWGENQRGQLGQGGDPEDGCTHGEMVPLACRPVPVALGGPASALAAGLHHTCAVVDDGEVRCFGGNEAGQLGDGSEFADSAEPVAVRFQQRISSVTAGESQTCATSDSGAVYCWGSNRAGQLAQTASLVSSRPAAVLGADGASAIAAGAHHTCAVIDRGIRCWGRNDFAQLGDQTQQARSSPVPLLGLTAVVTQLAPGEQHTCFISGTGAVRCWGRNTHGEIGPAGDQEIELAPVAVNIGGEALQVAAGDEHACAVRADLVPLCWGNDSDGQLGNGVEPEGGPYAVDLADAAEVATGDEHTCARDSAGVVYCWGENEAGQLGDSSTADRDTPPAAGLELAAEQIASGDDFSCARSSGLVSCWGANEHGQLGAPGPARSLVPVAVADLPPATLLALGSEHACAIVDREGAPAVMCWGRNDGGQLGDGTTDPPLGPVAVDLPGTPLGLATGERHTCALVQPAASATQVYCWGSDVDGTLGSGRDLYYRTAIGPIAVCQ